MRLPLVKSRQLRRRWQYAASEGCIIWKLVPAANDVLIVDERDAVKFTSRILAINVLTGECRWISESPFDPWWSNLTAASGDRAILEGYASRDMPIAKGVAALDLSSGKVAWVDANAQLLDIGASTVKVRRTEYGIERVSWLRLLDGAPCENAGHEPYETGAFHYPHDLEVADIKNLLSKDEVARVCAPIEGLDVAGYEVRSFYLQNEREVTDLMRQTFRCELAVTREARTVLRETIGGHSPFPVAGNFFVEHDILIYVEEKTRLVGVSLTNVPLG
jgi:hypothetical protein